MSHFSNVELIPSAQNPNEVEVRFMQGEYQKAFALTLDLLERMLAKADRGKRVSLGPIPEELIQIVIQKARLADIKRF